MKLSTEMLENIRRKLELRGLNINSHEGIDYAVQLYEKLSSLWCDYTESAEPAEGYRKQMRIE